MSPQGRTRRRFVVAAGVTTALGLAGCTGDPGGTPDGTDDGNENGTDASGDDSGNGGHHDAAIEGPNPSATVSMATTDEGSHFEPHVVWVEQGGTVTWELESGSHTATAYHEAVDRPRRIPDGANGWDSGTLSEAGATFDHTFETDGVYDYFCAPHEGSGMIGSVIVGEPEAAGQPGLEPPQEDLPDEAAAKIESLNERIKSALSGGQDDDHGDGHGKGNETGDGDTSHGGNETEHSGDDHH